MAKSLTADTWTPRHEDAAFLVAEDRLTDQQIADQIGISKRTLETWKKSPAFKAKVNEYLKQFCQLVKEVGIGSVEARLRALDKDFNRLEAVIKSRAKRYQEQSHKAEEENSEAGKAMAALAPKGAPKPPPTIAPPEEALTGVVVFELVPTKNGNIERWTVDTGTIAEKRNLMQQAAKELGQWKERAEVEVRDTSARDALKRKLLKSARAGSDSAVSGQPT